MSSAPAATPQRTPRHYVRTILWLAVAITIPLVWQPVTDHVKAGELLLRLNSPNRPHHLLPAYDIKESIVTVEAQTGAINAKLYVPQGLDDPPSMVVVHGVHHLGIEEPRMVAFARSLAKQGIQVLTPELSGIADYRVDMHSMETIGYAAADLSKRSHDRQIGVLGLSFAGGLALIAATDPRFAPKISFVVAVGAHDDMERVARFFATDEIATPTGTQHLQAHEYGPMVLIYEHPAEFFSPEDLGLGREALRALLYENVDEAKEKTARLSPSGQKLMQSLIDNHSGENRAILLEQIRKHGQEMAAVSPHGKLGGLRADVLLLHGAGDDVIPASESEWLAREVPTKHLRAVLITPLLSHVDMQSGLHLRDRWRLLHFMAGMFAEARETTY